MPWTHPLSCSPRDDHWKSRGGDSLQNPFQFTHSPKEGRTDVSLGGEAPRLREGRLCSSTWQFLWRQDVWFPSAVAWLSCRSSEDTSSEEFMHCPGGCGEGCDGRGRGETNYTVSSWRLHCAAKFPLDRTLSLSTQINPRVREVWGDSFVPIQCEILCPKLPRIISSFYYRKEQEQMLFIYFFFWRAGKKMYSFYL